MSAQATKKPNANRLAIQMVVALAAGIIVGLIFMAIRENIDPSTWTAINNILFQDITAEGAESAIGIFYIGGQLFVRALQVVIVPMVFTSIAMAIGTVSDARTLGRISTKTLLWFLMSTAGGLLLASVVGMIVFDMGLFSVNLDGLSTSSGSTSSNPLLVFLNIVPSNIASVFSSNTEVLAIVFLAAATGLCMNKLGFEKTTTMRRLLQELNDIVTVFLNFVVTKFAPIAIFLLISRTFATYGIEYIRPAIVYMVLTVILLLIYLFGAYPLMVFIGTRLSPKTFLRKIMGVILFGFSTSSSAATLPMNYETCVKRMGVDKQVASFVLPLGMTINMDGTAIMQVVATLFIAGAAGYDVSVGSLIVIALLALVASVRHPCRPRGRRGHPLYHPLGRRVYGRRGADGLQPDPRDQSPDRDAGYLPQLRRRLGRVPLRRKEREAAQRGRLQREIIWICRWPARDSGQAIFLDYFLGAAHASL